MASKPLDTLSRISWMMTSVISLLAVWWIAALLIQSRYLPLPQDVFSILATELANGELLFHVSMTLMRVAASFLVAMVIGSAIGIAMGRQAWADRLFDGWLMFFLNLPALVTIVLCFIWFGLTEVATVFAVAINKIPNVAVTLREGTRALDPAYEQLARAYRFKQWKTLRHVLLPQLAPYFAAAARSGLALVWKIVLVVELLGRSNGVGFQIHLYFQLFDVAAILAYAISFIVVVQLIETFILQPWQQSAVRWRT
ncbi:ABC transporter permease [Anderseniella sp. Alg231-50]|uniref:ABC transporter permease n=1 Tax=Anderseniella sp. Alg231-50 TaxID=1922226 RepID=UPI00307C0704